MTLPTEIDYRSLLGTPFADMDCRGVVAAFYQLAGHPLPHGCLSRPESLQETFWQRVGVRARHAVLPGDVLASDPREGGVISHVAVMTAAAGDGGLALSSCEHFGVYTVKRWDVRGVLGIYRPRDIPYRIGESA